MGDKFEDVIFDSLTKAEVCVQCVEKFEEYDNYCLEAARVQDEISTTFKNNQVLRQASNESLKLSTCKEEYTTCEELNTQYVMNDDENFDIVEYVEDEPESTEETAELQENSFTSKAKRKYVFNKYTCGICNEKFQKKRDYQLHSKLSHVPENTEIFECPQCNGTSLFASEMEYNLHLVISHPIDPDASSFECPVCNKAFTTKSLLNRHFGIHSSNSERPLACEFCGKTFFHFSSFRAHIKIHKDIRDYTCTQCSKSFRSQSHLNRHSRIHTKQKDHECPGQTFLYPFYAKII